MSQETITLELTIRETVRKGIGQLRRDGFVPGVIHDHGKVSIAVQGEYQEVYKVFIDAGKHHPVQIKAGDKKYTTLIKDVTFIPGKGTIQHVVFNAIRANEKVAAEIPVRLVGEVPAERLSLLVLNNLDVVEVEALPKDLVDALEVDATTLAEVGDRVFVSDIKTPAGITIKTDPELAIATVEMPKDQIAEADAAAADLAADAAASGDGTETDQADKESAEESADSDEAKKDEA